MITKRLPLSIRSRLARFAAGTALACVLGNNANAITYNWINDPLVFPGIFVASFVVPDTAVSDGIIDATELTSFDLTITDGVASSATGSYTLDASYNIVGGSLASIVSAGFGIDLDVNIFADRWTVSAPANTPLWFGRWEYDSAPVVPPQGVPDATSTVGALGLACAALVGLRRRRLADSLSA